MGTIHLDYCKLETIDREFRHKLFCGFGNSNRLRLFLRFINIFFFVLLDDFVSSSFVVFSFSFSLFFSLFDSFAAKHPLNGCRVTFCSFKRMTDADGDRWKSLFTLDAQSLVCLLIRFCLHASLISLSLSVCARSISVRFQRWEEMLWQTQLHRPCMLNWAPPFHRILFSHTHTHTTHTDGKGHLCLTFIFWQERETLEIDVSHLQEENGNRITSIQRRHKIPYIRQTDILYSLLACQSSPLSRRDGSENDRVGRPV